VPEWQFGEAKDFDHERNVRNFDVILSNDFCKVTLIDSWINQRMAPIRSIPRWNSE
jgi:hypothetical protein